MKLQQSAKVNVFFSIQLILLFMKKMHPWDTTTALVS